MAINREILKKMIDGLSEDKLTKLHDILDQWLDDELTKSDILEIKKAEKRIASGDFDTLEDLYEKYRDEF